MIDTGTNELLCEVKNGVAVLTLNRPEKRNSLSDVLTPALREMVQKLDERSDVRCLVITGEGGSFCAGGDLGGMSGGQLVTGVESFDDNVRKESGRFSVSNDQQLEKIRELEKKNIQVSAMYILGFPTDTDETINKTINYSKKLNTTYAQFSVWTPYPGTPVFNEYKDKIIVNNYDEFDQYNLVYKHNLFNKEHIRKYLSKAYSSYYLRINWLFKYFKSFITS